MELVGENRTRSIPDSYLLVGLDETGHESPSSAHPVFGIGGCAVPVRDYERLVKTPWQILKSRYFGRLEVPLHAADLRPPKAAQSIALGDFFRSGSFGRIAALVSVQTTLEPNVSPYQLVARLVMDRIARLVKRLRCDGVVLILEESQRTDRLAAAYFSGYHLQLKSSSGSRSLETLKFRMPKAAAEPFLEVADFVAHAAGGQVRSHLDGKTWGTRKDFQAVFGIPDQTLVEFVETLSAEWNAPMAGDIH